jgi:hypothetical protein
LLASDGLLGYPTSKQFTFNLIPHIAIVDNLTLFYASFVVALVLMMFGIGRRWTVAAVFVATKIHDDLLWVLLDGGDNLMQFSLMYLVLADSFQFFSVSKSKSQSQAYALSHLFTNVAVALIVGHLCLAYLISGLSKARAEVWFNGTAMYYILLSERFQGTQWNEFFGKSALFNVVVCYTTIIWEATFPFAVFARRLRGPVLMVGVAMHIGIFVMMMIHMFQIIFVFHYGFFFTDDEWARFIRKIRGRIVNARFLGRAF